MIQFQGVSQFHRSANDAPLHLDQVAIPRRMFQAWHSSLIKRIAVNIQQTQHALAGKVESYTASTNQIVMDICQIMP